MVLESLLRYIHEEMVANAFLCSYVCMVQMQFSWLYTIHCTSHRERGLRILLKGLLLKIVLYVKITTLLMFFFYKYFSVQRTMPKAEPWINQYIF